MMKKKKKIFKIINNKIYIMYNNCNRKHIKTNGYKI